MTLTLDPRLHSEAVKTAISDALDQWSAWDYGKVPGSDGNHGKLPDIFALVSVERRSNPNLRLSANASSVGWRVSVRVVGRTVKEAQWALSRVAEALNEARLMILTDTGPRHTTPIQFESDQTPDRDDGRYSAVSTWTYAH